jgi:hypothetical protein
MSDITESPKLIPSSNWGLDTSEKNKTILDRLKKKQKQIDAYNGVPIYQSGRVYFSTSLDGNKITYLMVAKVDRIRSLKMRYATQTLVWRLGGGYTKGLASHMFWTHLFPLHETIMSDSKQTKEGQRFWMDRVDEAFQKGLRVYRTNIRTGESKEETNAESLFGSDTYGDTDIFKLYRIVISKEKLEES